MSLFSVSSFFVFSCTFFIALFVLLKSKDRGLGYIWFFMCMSNVVWGIGSFKFSLTDNYNNAFFWWQIAYIGIIGTPVFFYHFVLQLLRFNQKKVLFLVYCIGAFSVFSVFFLPQFFLGNIIYKFGQFYYQDWTKSYSLLWLFFYITLYWILLIYTFVLLIVKYKSSRGNFRQQIKYIILASVIGWLGPHGAFLPVLGINIYPYSNFFIAFWPSLIAYAIVKHRLMDIRVFISKAIAFSFGYIFFVAVPFVFAYYYEDFLQDILGRHWWLVPSGMILVVSYISPIIYFKIRQEIDKQLLKEQQRYRTLLLKSAEGMIHEHDLSQLCKLIVYIIKKNLKLKYAAIYLKDNDSDEYYLKQSIKRNRLDYKLKFREDSHLIRLLKHRYKALIYEELSDAVKEELTSITELGMIVPSFRGKEIVGILFLGEKLNREAYTVDDIQMFDILSKQAALAIMNSMYINEFKRAQERMFASEKLASIGGMADGMAHQIKNRLNQFSVGSGEIKLEIQDYIDKHKDVLEQNPDLKKSLDYIIQVSDSLVNNVKRTDSILKGILNFARTDEKDGYFGFFSTQDIVERAVELLKVKHQITEFPVEVIFNGAENIYGVKVQIMEVLYNLMDNAYESIEVKAKIKEEQNKEFKPLIKITFSEDTKNYYISIVDNGEGIRLSDKKKVFAPFFTTKSSYKSGSGIGMYIVQRMIVENHHGSITFESIYLEGVEFNITLPKKEKE
ncbi:MAG: ATP-binding protein [Candidatus Omnitrophota bacterium]